jgi:hypothetical protein
MSGKSIASTAQASGPTGFIEVGGQMLVVDYGKIYHDTTEGASGMLGSGGGLIAIDKIPGCVFRGIDASGMELVLPGDVSGPTGSLTYNGLPLHVVHGRVSTSDHKLVGAFTDEGVLSIRDTLNRTTARTLDENTQLGTHFKGNKSTGQLWQHEFSRPLYRKDKKYSENEIIRYFENFDGLNTTQKKYVLSSLSLWAKCGLLQIVRKSEGTAALGNVKHGASGVTGVRTGYVTLDKEEFEKEIVLSKKFGALAVVATRIRPYIEVRLNQVVSHEYGHQLEFILSQATQDTITDLYQKRLSASNKLHPVPEEYEGQSELLMPQKVSERVFISGYAKSSMHEYWAECTAAFSVKESRELLKQLDPSMHKLLVDLTFTPEKMVRPVFIDSILDLQASLRAGGELTDGLLDE